MKIQNLAVLFIIIILPISMILTSYTQNQVKTLGIQTSYDTKLNNATHDALKAFQLNTMNSDTSDLSNSKLRDIEASANTFFNSVASNFNMAGYNQDILAEYVPALVYTMYDGYYIYSKYTNTLDSTNSNEVIVNEMTGETDEQSDAEILSNDREDVTYKQNQKLAGLKPYIYYSCRYKYNGNDFVITYSLDNYITIQGMINVNGEMKWVYDAGYLLDNVTGDITSSGDTYYRGVKIDTSESLKECIDETKKEYTYIKVNGVKYYQNDDGSWFSILNGSRYPQQNFVTQTNAGIKYYREAEAFKRRITNDYNLGDLNASHAVDETGASLVELDANGNRTNIPKLGNYKIFDFGNMNGTSIEDPNSNFNQQRLAVIRYSIEKNLSIAIANFNDYSGVTANFQMPKLQEDEWDKIVNNVSIISFLQGLNIGGKVYNGYSIITNNKNEEVVSEDSIYIISKNDSQYHRANDVELKGKNNLEGVFNVDLEIKSITDANGVAKYFIPKQLNGNLITGSYSSIVNQTGVEQTDNLYQYMANLNTQNPRLAQVYFTALGRERYSSYKTYNDPEKEKEKFTP